MLRSVKFRIIVGILFIILGLSLIFYPQINREISAVEEKRLITAFEQLGEYEIDELELTDDKTEENNELTILKDAYGIIRIPTIDAELMILKNDRESSLSKGVGMIEPDKEIGINNVGLAGHRALAHGRLFNRLDEVNIDDKIFVKTKTAELEFIVVDTFVVDRTEIHVLDDKPEPYLTLVTCTPVGAYRPTNRLIVQAKLLDRK